MAGYFSGIMSSVKGYLGYETLETESGGSSEDKVEHQNTTERQGLWKQLSSYIGISLITLELPIMTISKLIFVRKGCYQHDKPSSMDI